MSRILAIDTTSAWGSLALLDRGEVVEEAALHSVEGFSQTIFQHIADLLRRNGWRADDIDCFAAASGPGSFTGVRVGLTAVKGLADATGKPAVAVSNLHALAECGSGTLRAVVMDARRGEVYGAVYDSQLQAVSAEVVMPFVGWIASLPAGVDEVISSDIAAYRGAFAENVRVVERRAIAAAVGRIATKRLAQGQASDPAALDANYVRRSDAELLWRDRTV